MGYRMKFGHMWTLDNDQIMVFNISSTSNIYHFFVVQHLESSLLVIEIYTTIFKIIVTLL